jgi:hypothetical protein
MINELINFRDMYLSLATAEVHWRCINHTHLSQLLRAIGIPISINTAPCRCCKHECPECPLFNFWQSFPVVGKGTPCNRTDNPSRRANQKRLCQTWDVFRACCLTMAYVVDQKILELKNEGN